LAVVARRLAAAVAGGALVAVVSDGVAARAQQLTIESLPLAAAYGNGVHGYFAGAYDRAYEDFSSAIEAGSTDPRAWYFRGLAALKLGRSDEAEADFAEGARRESETGGCRVRNGWHWSGTGPGPGSRCCSGDAMRTAGGIPTSRTRSPTCCVGAGPRDR
jgi:tetratricopeptide (TPR) repeat protein